MPASQPNPASPEAPTAARRRWSRTAVGIVVLAALCCGAALMFRAPIQGRLWAHRVIAASDAAERAAYLTLLCNAGDDARWGVETLLSHAEPAMRQHGVVVLHHVRRPWSRERLTAALLDPDAIVSELAAVGLAIHGDDSVAPRLVEIFRSGAPEAARAASVALGRLATPTAMQALAELAAAPLDLPRAAALIDALEASDRPEAVPILIPFLTDERACGIPSRAEQRAVEALSGVGLGGGRATLDAGSLGLSEPTAPRTVAARAAAALDRLTGKRVPFSTSMPAASRAAAIEVWREWYDAHATTRPAGSAP